MSCIPAIQEVRFSLTSSRGCFGECSFCALTFHQGRIVQSRSHESLLEEAELLTREPGFKGYIHDVGGPTANFRAPACRGQLKRGACRHQSCLYPDPCKALEADHADYLALLRKLRAVPGVKKVFVRSGVRFDYVLADRAHGDEFLRELCEHHVSGQLKVAPEHCVNHTLDYMGKPHIEVYEKFRDKYFKLNRRYGKDQYLVPYLISSHPGCTLEDAVELAVWLNKEGHMPEQVQDFYPTPGTLATCMWYTGIDPRTMKPVFVPKTPHDKALQRALMQWRKPQNRALVMEALKKTGRTDLIGYGKECLIRPAREERSLSGSNDKKRETERRNYGEKSRNNEKNSDKTGRTRNRDGSSQMGKNNSAKKKTIRNVHKKK